ncbi:MAG: hypothetical protein K2Q45_01515 [Nitrosomonas sp.]|nr:hypothetical protein [Nitrosomonas sp.]
MQSDDIDHVQVDEFVLLKTKLCIAGSVHCIKWKQWFENTFKMEIIFSMYPQVNLFVHEIEKELEYRVSIETFEEDQRARFVFLCCVNTIFYKDIRKMLFQEIAKTQEEMWEKNITKVKKTIASINKNLIT